MDSHVQTGLTWHRYDVSANVSLLFTELPLLERFAAARQAGFTAVECWWPFPTADPDPGAVEEILETIEDSGVRLTGMNVFAGDMAAGERGIACAPERADELEASLAVLRTIAQRTGCRGFNLLHGQVPPDADQAAQEAAQEAAREAAVHAYRRAAETMSGLTARDGSDISDGVILVEPLARGLNGAYPLETAQDALELIDEVGAPNVMLLLDTFHLTRNGVDIVDLIEGAADRIGHVQLADSPDRGEPGGGSVDFAAIGSALRAHGYTGTVAAEYRPTEETLRTLDWLTPAPDSQPLA
ncbi:hydroxypyruvate isomerase family protein [Brachybacterium sp. GCM10030267]|uniref:hydroxypyruvate isomerase family protein n=1 Tax=unclassified Brachybacterium TaxID=2623841 RepID=UPI00360B3E4D